MISSIETRRLEPEPEPVDIKFTNGSLHMKTSPEEMSTQIVDVLEGTDDRDNAVCMIYSMTVEELACVMKQPWFMKSTAKQLAEIASRIFAQTESCDFCEHCSTIGMCCPHAEKNPKNIMDYQEYPFLDTGNVDNRCDCSCRQLRRRLSEIYHHYTNDDITNMRESFRQVFYMAIF